MFEEYSEWIKKNKLVVAGGLVLVLALAAFFFFQKSPESSSPDFQTLSSSQTTMESEEKTESQETTEDSQTILVDVKGAVKEAGLYELAPSARVNDAIQAAGGFSEQADKKSVNLAQKLSDEAVIYVASQGENISVVSPENTPKTDGQSANSGADKINLNTASVADLTTISGIGEKRANDILTYRDSNGGFKSIDDLKNVSGIGDKTLETIRPYVTVD